MAGTSLPPAPFLYPILDVALLGDLRAGDCVAVLARAGVRMVQLRAKALPDRAFLEVAFEAVAAAHSSGCRLIVNDRTDVARITGADGVHVGQDDLGPGDVRAVLGPAAIVGLSTHSVLQVEAAARQPIDYVAVGPIFPTGTKQDPDPVVGVDFIREARHRTSMPLVAIGGIGRETASQVVEAGASGVAVISALLEGGDLGVAAQGLIASLGRTR